jgi:hypothetical protein
VIFAVECSTGCAGMTIHSSEEIRPTQLTVEGGDGRERVNWCCSRRRVDNDDDKEEEEEEEEEDAPTPSCFGSACGDLVSTGRKGVAAAEGAAE